ncbi:MAG TPA: AAA family ATPase [Chitinophagales bacterium]|nr:AAA family ATPase [Chitinophagales bacterium]
MLHRITIKNYAIIEGLEIQFNERMNIITGETGAGKSILLGALSLILGDRADTKVLFDKNEKCVVEADFEITDASLRSFFAHNELDFEVHTIVRREINQSGKSRAFVNDTPVTLSVLKELGEKLVNLHSQHETLDLIKAGFQMGIVDVLAGNRPLLETYRNKFDTYKNGQKQLEVMTEQLKSAHAEMDYLQFQLKEFTEARLEAGEQEPLEAEQNTLSNVEEIKTVLQQVVQGLSGNEMAVLEQLSELQSNLKGVKNYSKDILALSGRLQSACEELKDIAAEFEGIQDNTVLDPERLEEVNGRLHTI